MGPLGSDEAQAVALLGAHPVLGRLRALLTDDDEPLYLVGGAVRDALRGADPLDLDVAGVGAIDLARRFAEAHRAHVVMLHDLPATARVPVHIPRSDRARVVDFCALRAPSIEADLAARDFTINSLAMELRELRFLDPTGGVADLRAGIVRAVAESNLTDDPLRCLRAYRLCGVLGLRLEERTRRWIQGSAPGLERVENQRIGEELARLLGSPDAARVLREMDTDGVLSCVLPELDDGRDMAQPGFHHLSVRAHAIAASCAMMSILADVESLLPQSATVVAEYATRPWSAPLLCMAALLHDVGKPACHRRDVDDVIRFTGHPATGAAITARILQRLVWPARVRDGAVGLVAHHMRVFELARLAIEGGRAVVDVDQMISAGAIRRMFRQVPGHEPGLVLVALADSLASRGPAKHAGYDGALATVCDQMLRRYVDYTTARAARPLLTGSDLISAGFQPGPLFSVLIEAVEHARADGTIQSRQQALDLARQIAEDGTRTEGAGQ